MSNSFKIIILVIAAVFSLVWAGIRTVNSITYNRDVGGHLKLAADANSIELAERQLELAIDGMDARGLCPSGGDCYTSVLYRTPDEDVGFWRENIVGTLADLQAMSPDERASNLIVSNQLLKVRETLLDSGTNGDQVTDPPGISIYGSNHLMAALGWISFLTLTLFGLWIGIRYLWELDE